MGGITPASPRATRHSPLAALFTRSRLQSTLGLQLPLGCSTPYPCHSSPLEGMQAEVFLTLDEQGSY